MNIGLQCYRLFLYGELGNQCWRVEGRYREEGWRPPQWLLSLLLCDCTVSGMWLGGMGRISHHLKGGSNQPQSLASGGSAFESQCFISKHKLLDQGFFCPRLYSEVRATTVRRVKEALVFAYVITCVSHVPIQSIGCNSAWTLKIGQNYTHINSVPVLLVTCLSLEIPFLIHLKPKPLFKPAVYWKLFKVRWRCSYFQWCPIDSVNHKRV